MFLSNKNKHILPLWWLCPCVLVLLSASEVINAYAEVEVYENIIRKRSHALTLALTHLISLSGMLVALKIRGDEQKKEVESIEGVDTSKQVGAGGRGGRGGRGKKDKDGWKKKAKTEHGPMFWKA